MLAQPKSTGADFVPNVNGHKVASLIITKQSTSHCHKQHTSEGIIIYCWHRWNIFIVNEPNPGNNFFYAAHEYTLRWRHNDHAGVSNHQPPGCLLNRLFRRKSKKRSKLRVTGLCAGNSPGTGEFSAQMASYAENVSISWRHHECLGFYSLNGRTPDRKISWNLEATRFRSSFPNRFKI